MTQLPYDVLISKENHRDAEQWCREHWGKRWGAIDNKKGIWCCFWAGFRGPNAGKYRFSFRNEADAVLFTLRWS